MPLPIEDVLPALGRALAGAPNAVLHAPPGAGKTTRVPLALLDEPWLAGRSIVMLEPRRLAARAAAARMAELLGEPVGATVGYRIRLDSRVSARTRIEVVTEGILTRRLQSDPELAGVGLVIFDEFHERHLHSDLALALCLDAQRGLREDLRVLVMSATLDTAAIARLMNGAPVIASEGRSYPVAVRYLAKDGDRRLAEAASAATLDSLTRDAGDILVFLPGSGEIRRAETLLAERVGTAVIHPLYGDLPKEAQDRAIRPDPAGRRKIVLSTPIAETSLTIEGIGVVIDSGYRRAPRFDPNAGLTRLETVRIARDAAEQRAGRAGRLGPGVCYRLWSEATDRGLVPRTMPEILSTDLAELALELAAWGVREPGSLSWLDAPPAAALAQAQTLLRALGALDHAGTLTDTGRRMAALPAHPRLAGMLLAAEPLQQLPLACDIAALLGERDILRREHASSPDIGLRLDALAAFRARGADGARAGGADAGACARVDQVARQLRAQLGAGPPPATYDERAVGSLVAHAYPDRVAAQRESQSGRYLLANGRGAALAAESGFRPDFLVALALDAGQAEGRIYLAASIERVVLQRQFPDRIAIEAAVRWDTQRQGVIAQLEERLGEIVLSARPTADADPDRVAEALVAGIRAIGIGALPWTPASRQWQARVLSLRHWLTEESWPDVSDEALAATLEAWLAPYIQGMRTRADLARLDLHAALQAHLDWTQRRRLDAEAPTHLPIPSGSHAALEYRAGEAPVLAVKLQELFGLAETPRVADGRVPVTLHLLSPARRPIQVTQDLRGFWERTYPEVKKELKGRYPKHPWPDDPWTAKPTARTKARM